MTDAFDLEPTDFGWRGSFSAMASPCQVLVRDQARALAETVVSAAAGEAWRVERKFSRYRDDNVMHAVNAGAGEWVDVDEETSRLLDYAHTCWQLSEGRFDVTSGVLRRVWRFDGSDRVPSAEAVRKVLPLVGWQKVERRPGRVRLAPGMEIDFGGIGKEYAVDRALALAVAAGAEAVLVNFGGDIAARGGRPEPWQIGLEGPDGGRAAGRFAMVEGGLATSGDSRRFLLHDGVRFGHVLDPRTGWPVMGGPRSVTVAAPQCTQAGMLATLALLRGPGAEAFLRAQGVRYWCLYDDVPEATR